MATAVADHLRATLCKGVLRSTWPPTSAGWQMSSSLQAMGQSIGVAD